MKDKFLNNIISASSPVIDGGGECGNITHYVFILTLVGSAFLIFLYLWKKGKLDMDEAPKHEMMNEEEKRDDFDDRT